MSKKSGKTRNLMLVERLLSRIAKYANELEKRLKEAHQMTRATFPMVQGMPSGNKSILELAVRVLMDCEGNAIACDHLEYGKEQNIGLHNDLCRGWGSHHDQGGLCLLSLLLLRLLESLGHQQPCANALQGHTDVRMARLLLCAHAVQEDD